MASTQPGGSSVVDSATLSGATSSGLVSASSIGWFSVSSSGAVWWSFATTSSGEERSAIGASLLVSGMFSPDSTSGSSDVIVCSLLCSRDSSTADSAEGGSGRSQLVSFVCEW